MVLTPQDVHDKQFKLVRQTTGYDMDEVDAFLDEVEIEVARLNSLLAERESALAAAQQAVASQPAAAPAEPAAGTGIESNALAAARILELAQRTADQHVAEAAAQGEQILSDARTRAAASVAELESQRVDLEDRVGRLLNLEGEVRTRLRGFLESQLQELNATEPEVEASYQPGDADNQ